MKIEKFTPPFCAQLRKDVEAALQPVREKYGLATLGPTGRGTYTEFDYHVKLEATLKNEESAKRDAIRNTENSQLLGYNQNIVGEIFEIRRPDKTIEFVVTRIDLKKRLWPIIALPVIPDGKEYKFKDDKPLRFKNPNIKLTPKTNTWE